MIFGILEFFGRFLLPSLLYLWPLIIFPDKQKRSYDIGTGDDKIKIYHDFLLPEKRHPLCNPCMFAGMCLYFGLYFSYYWLCSPYTDLLEVVVGILWSFIIVGDMMLAIAGLGDWAFLPGSASCFL